MPHDLFSDVSARRASRTKFRRLLTIVSVALHAIVIAAVLVAQLFASSPLPVPHRPLIFESIQFVQLVAVPLPPPPRRAPNEPSPPVSANAAPTFAPSGIIDETGRESERSTVARSDSVVRVERGSGNADLFSLVDGAAAPPPPPPARHGPIHLHSGMRAPVKVVHVRPVYPPIAQSARVHGVVILEAIIDAGGRVKSVSVLRSIPLLDQAAVDAVRQWQFTPALLNGEPVPVVMTVTVNFELAR